MASIRLDKIGKRFGGVPALAALDLDIADREFMVFLGPSGCGKTTTLNIIAGLEEPTSGDVYFGDRRVTFTPPHQRDIAMVFQSYALYPQKTVRENMGFGLKLRGTPGEEIARKVDRAAAELEVAHLLDRRPHQLSGGQRQRVALGRAIVREPAVFLMDEPLSNLDAALRVSMRTLIKKLHRQMRSTVVYVTHDQAEAMTLADRVTVMRDGVVQQVDTPEGVYERPANRFVASFLGSPQMNFVEGEIVAGHDGPAFVQGELRLPLGPAYATAGGLATLGLRAEDAAIVAAGAGDLPAEVVLVSPLGSEQHIDLTTPGGDIVLRAGKEARLRPGDRVGVAVDRSRLHLFDRASGARIAPS